MNRSFLLTLFVSLSAQANPEITAFAVKSSSGQVQEITVTKTDVAILATAKCVETSTTTASGAQEKIFTFELRDQMALDSLAILEGRARIADEYVLPDSPSASAPELTFQLHFTMPHYPATPNRVFSLRRPLILVNGSHSDVAAKIYRMASQHSAGCAPLN